MNEASNKKEKNIVFFIEKAQFKTELTELSVRVLLEEYAKEDSSETTLVLKRGNKQHKYTDLNEMVTLENGMKFIVFHNTPTAVSWL